MVVKMRRVRCCVIVRGPVPCHTCVDRRAATPRSTKLAGRPSGQQAPSRPLPALPGSRRVACASFDGNRVGHLLVVSSWRAALASRGVLAPPWFHKSTRRHDVIGLGVAISTKCALASATTICQPSRPALWRAASASLQTFGASAWTARHISPHISRTTGRVEASGPHRMRRRRSNSSFNWEAVAAPWAFPIAS